MKQVSEQNKSMALVFQINVLFDIFSWKPNVLENKIECLPFHHDYSFQCDLLNY